MFDLSNEFYSFYRNFVVLPKDDVNNLLEKKRANINRLREGLEDYNKENSTNYLLKDDVIQGSVAMATITQNDKKDYDIDVAIIFEKEEIPEGTIATKNFVRNALNRRCRGFKNEPEIKTNCIRITYEEGYQIDLAIYRREQNQADFNHEHCGSDWRERDPRAIKKWFFDCNKEQNYNLRKVVRLLKMFSKSRTSWANMPGGLILTVLANEQLKECSRLDETFYHSIKAIFNRLGKSKEILDPTDLEKSLILKKSDENKVNNFFNRLGDSLEKLEVLMEINCSEKDAFEAWSKFFNHEFWERPLDEISRDFFHKEKELEYNDTEEFIEFFFPVDLKYDLELDCSVEKGNEFVGRLRTLLKEKKPLLLGKKLNFIAETNTPQPYNVFWKVKNCGYEAKKENKIRGQLLKTDSLRHTEETCFKGPHYVECYIEKNGVCVARGRINVPILVSTKY